MNERRVAQRRDPMSEGLFMCQRITERRQINAASQDRGTERLRERTSASNSSPVNAAPELKVSNCGVSAPGLMAMQLGGDEAWDNRTLGADERYAAPCNDPNCPDERKYGRVHPAPTTPSKLPLSERFVRTLKDEFASDGHFDAMSLCDQALAAISLEQRVKEQDAEIAGLRGDLRCEQSNRMMWKVRTETQDSEIARLKITCELQTKEASYQAEMKVTAIERAEKAERELAAAQKELADLKHWLDNNTTFYDVDADWPVDAQNVPTLAQVSERIWYHATDDIKSYPFSEVAALAAKEKA